MAHARVQEVSREAAARALASVVARDPDGLATAENVAAAGVPLLLEVEGGHATMVLARRGPGARQLWVEGAVGGGEADMTAIGLRFIEDTAHQAGCTEVAFQTSRRGLVRKAERLGYQVRGYILRKAIL